MLYLVLVLSVSALTTLLYLNKRRASQEIQFDLKPNCLLSRYPLIFITGHRSLFYFLKYWNQIPDFLAEHGYQVFTLPLPWRNHQQRLNQLRRVLQDFEQRQQKFHFFFDMTSLPEVEALLEKTHYQCIESLTLVHNRSLNTTLSRRLRPLSKAIEELAFSQDLAPKKILGVQAGLSEFHCYLDRAQFLAERDFAKSP